MRARIRLWHAAAFAILVTLPGVASGVSIQSGDILVSGGNYTSPGIARLLPDGSTQLVTPGVFGPIAVDQNSGRIYVMGPDGNGHTALLEINRATGTPHVVAENSQFEIGSLTVAPDGTVYSMDAYYNGAPQQQIFRIDPSTGQSQVVFQNQSAVGPLAGALFTGIASTADGQLLTIAGDSSFSPTSPGSIYRIDPATGQASFVADPPELTHPNDLEVLADGRIVSASVTPNCTGAQCAQTIILDPSTSAETVLDTALIPFTPYDLELDGSGNLLIVGPTTNGEGNVVRVDLTTGAQTVLGNPVALSGYFYVAYVPEPGTVALLALAIAIGTGLGRSSPPAAALTPRG